MLSCRSCQQKCTNIQALSESPLEVCISTGLVTLCPWFHCFSVLVEFELLSPPKLGGDVDTMSPDQHAQGKCRNPFYLPVSGSRARGTRQIVMSRTRHGALFSTFRRRILRGGYIAWRILRSGTLEGPAGWPFDPSAEGAMTTAHPPLSFLMCPCLSFCKRDCCLSPCCHTLRRRSLTKNALLTQRGVGSRPIDGFD